MIGAWLARLGATVWAWVVAAGALLLLLFTFWRSAKRIGKAEEREAQVETDKAQAVVKQQEREAVHAVETETLQVSNEVKADVVRLDPGVAEQQLRDKWQRD